LIDTGSARGKAVDGDQRPAGPLGLVGESSSGELVQMIDSGIGDPGAQPSDFLSGSV